MFQWLRRRRKSKPLTEEQRILQSLVDSKCPDCGNDKFLFGPQACGTAQNIECEGCGQCFNVALMEDGKFYNPIFAHRIGWNHSHRWEEPGKLKVAA